MLKHAADHRTERVGAPFLLVLLSLAEIVTWNGSKIEACRY